MADFLSRRARRIVVVWILSVVALGFLGRGLADELQLHPVYVDGTQSERAHEIAREAFGNEHAMVVMLRGPRGAVEQQGKRLADGLEQRSRLLVVSPWSAGAAVDGLRPDPGVAAIVVRSQEVADEDVTDLLVPVERQVDRDVSGPVQANIAGFPAIIDSSLKANERALKVGELIAVPVLLLVLLFVFRSALAALLPLVVGGAVVVASQGVLYACLAVVDLDLFALAVVGMMGLALGVDYSLLVVSRFREERNGRSSAEAAGLTMRATARSVIPAGSGLLLAMFAATLVLPGTLALSVAIAVATATVLSMVSALCVTPALLTLLGDNLDRWVLPRRNASRSAPLLWSRRLTAHPPAVAPFVAVLFFLALWAFTLQSGSASVGFLPAGDQGRVQQEEVERALGPGWVSPMEVVLDGRGTPLTSGERLRELTAFQRRVERDPGVQTVAGFDRIERGARQARGIEQSLAEQERGLERLDRGLARLREGTEQNTSGLFKAAEGARGLSSGIAAANAGSSLLADALAATGSGSRQLNDGLVQASDGSDELAQGTSNASSGASRLAEGLEKAREGTGEIQSSVRLLENAMKAGNERLTEVRGPLQATKDHLGAAFGALQRMTSGRSDSEYGAALLAVEEAQRQLGGPAQGGVEQGVERAEGQFDVGLYLTSKLEENGREAEDGLAKLARGSAKLDEGLHRLKSGSGRLADGIAKLSEGGEKLPPALAKLNEGADRLVGGLTRLEGGSSHLADGLGGGAQQSTLMSRALRRIGRGLERQGGEDGGSQLGRLQQQSPDLFDSSYFVLAGLDGSRPERRAQINSLISLDRGGQYGRMLVIPREESTSEVTRATKDRLEEATVGLGRRTGTEAALGGVAPATIDADHALRVEALDLRLALSLVSFLILVPVVRSLILPLVAALLNLLAVSATFGLLSLLFNSSLLGGPGFVDSTVIPATVIVMFGLAIDYEVFVFARIREEYERTGSTEAAIRQGLDRVAHVVTGAALIMIAVFLAFSVSELITLRNFGVAQAIGVFIDAFIIRLLIIPVVMAGLGKWNWWIPAWLDRILPRPMAFRRAPS